MERDSPTVSPSSLKGEDGGHPPQGYVMGQGSHTAFSSTSMKGEDGASPFPGPGATVGPRGWGFPYTMPAQFGTYSEACPGLGKLNHVKAGGRESTTSSKTFF